MSLWLAWCERVDALVGGQPSPGAVASRELIKIAGPVLFLIFLSPLLWLTFLFVQHAILGAIAPLYCEAATACGLGGVCVDMQWEEAARTVAVFGSHAWLLPLERVGWIALLGACLVASMLDAVRHARFAWLMAVAAVILLTPFVPFLVGVLLGMLFIAAILGAILVHLVPDAVHKYGNANF